MAKPNIIVAEIGSWQGLSTSAIVNVIKPFNGVCYCIDHWRGSPHEPNELEFALAYDVFQIFKSNMIGYDLWGNIRVMMMSSLDAAFTFTDNVLDLVFIDADHSYDSVITDIKGWLPKVKPGGIICGHDWDPGHMGVKEAVDKIFKGSHNFSPSCIWWHVKNPKEAIEDFIFD